MSLCVQKDNEKYFCDSSIVNQNNCIVMVIEKV